MRFSYSAGIILILSLTIADNAFGATSAMQAMRDALNAAARGRSAGGIGSGGYVMPKTCEQTRIGGSNFDRRCWTQREIWEDFKNKEQQKKDDLARAKQRLAEEAANRKFNADMERLMRGTYRRPVQTPEQLAAFRAAQAAEQERQRLANEQWMRDYTQSVTVGTFEDCEKNARDGFSVSCGSTGVAQNYVVCKRRNAMQGAMVPVVGVRGSCIESFRRCIAPYANQCTSEASIACLPDPFRCQ